MGRSFPRNAQLGFSVTKTVKLKDSCLKPPKVEMPLQHVVALEGTQHPRQQTFERFFLGFFTPPTSLVDYGLTCPVNSTLDNETFGKK